MRKTREPFMAVKDPDATLDYTIGWDEWLEGDIIATSTWIADPVSGDNFAVGSSTHDDTTATVWLSGGVHNTNRAVVNRITTVAGRTDDRTLMVHIRNK